MLCCHVNILPAANTGDVMVGAIAGAVAAVVVATVIVAIIIAVVCVTKKKRSKRSVN